MGEHITKNQSQRRCHCYGPVRTPASWCLGCRHPEDFGGGLSGQPRGPQRFSPASLLGSTSRLSGRTVGARASRLRGCLGAWAQLQPRPPPRAPRGRAMQPPGPPPAYSPSNGDFTFVTSADAEGETEPQEGPSPRGTPGRPRGGGGLSGAEAVVAGWRRAGS